MNISKRIPLQKVYNTRDLGGITTQDGGRIRHKQLYRSGQLYFLGHDDKELLTGDYNLRDIIDFRTEKERRERPDPALNLVRATPLEIIKDETLGITHDQESDKKLVSAAQDAHESMTNLYKEIITSDYSATKYSEFLHLLAKPSNGAYLWHCSAGKDRVGIGTAILLYTLGVSLDDIMEDYLATSDFLQPEVEHMIKSAQDMNAGDDTIEAMRVFMGVDEEYLAAALHTMLDLEGSIDNYLERRLKLDAHTKSALRTLYLD
ncbi:tyrosine-protein phosphatase [Lachnospiraceae bacterium OttesenSCG-928-J05]|nr:tyrosine-protein phosphatase [Lachnospiraceae bacterium OttesenSCG-928-J05]